MLSTLATLSLASLASATDATTLRGALDGKHFFVGAALNFDHIREDKDYASIAGQEFNLLTAENECKTNTIAQAINRFDFIKCDYIRLYAKKYNMAMRGHNLLWANTGQDYY